MSNHFGKQDHFCHPDLESGCKDRMCPTNGACILRVRLGVYFDILHACSFIFVIGVHEMCKNGSVYFACMLRVFACILGLPVR